MNKAWAQISSVAAAVALLAGLIAGYQTLLDFQPFFALKAQVQADERRYAFNRISDLQFQIDRLSGQNVSSDTVQQRIDERNYLNCTFQFDTGHCPPP